MTNLLSDLDHINQMVIEMTGDASAANYWWTEPNKAFGGETPKNMWLKNPEAVQTYINTVFFGGW